jgi:hypothetical protein
MSDKKEIRFSTLFFVLVLKTAVFSTRKKTMKKSFTFFNRTNSYVCKMSHEINNATRWTLAAAVVRLESVVLLLALSLQPTYYTKEFEKQFPPTRDRERERVREGERV